MKYLLFLIFNLFLFVSLLNGDQIVDQEEILISKLCDTIEFLENNENTVFNSFHLSETPIVITFPNQHIYGLSMKSKNPVWKKKVIKGKSVLYTEKDEWGVLKNAMQDNFLLDGENVFVFSMQINENQGFLEKPIMVLIHELFHKYQFAHFKGVSEFGEYRDSHQIENLTWINIEERLLVDFLSVRKEDRLDVLKYYMAVYLTRKNLIHEDSVKWECFQQLMEGLADYASIETFNQFEDLSHVKMHKHLQYLLMGYIQSIDQQDLAVKWRHYGVGATLGVALDFLQVKDWKKRIQVDGETQISILEKEIVLSDKEIKKRLDYVKKRYGYREIYREMESHVNGFNEMLNAYIEDHQNEEGIVVTIERPFDVAINGGGSSVGIYHLEDGTSISVKDRSYSSSTDDLWKLEIKQDSYLLQDRMGSRKIKLCKDVKVQVEGVHYFIHELLDLEEAIEFESISWDCDKSKFQSNQRKGWLRIENEEIIISLEELDLVS